MNWSLLLEGLELPYVVAEVGSNWQTKDQAIESVAAAAAAGADCVKFQAFYPEDLWGFYPEGASSHMGQVFSWLPDLRKAADAAGIDFACTAFSVAGLQAVEPFVHWHKIASSDCCWPDLLRAAVRTGEPVAISTGGHALKDVSDAVGAVPAGADQLLLMYCSAAYPARQLDLRAMRAFGSQRGVRWGLSDHSENIYLSAQAAAANGAVLIEKHFTAFPSLDTPDRPHSLTPWEFEAMVDGLRDDYATPQPYAEEREMVYQHRRRLVVTAPVAPGEPLRLGKNCGYYRGRDEVAGHLFLPTTPLPEGVTFRAGMVPGDSIATADLDGLDNGPSWWRRRRRTRR